MITDSNEILRQVRRVEIKARGLSKELFAGEYHTAFKGRGMAFSEVREYAFGDDIRNIDWNVTARYNAPFVKVFEEERELTVMLAIDMSASIGFGTQTTIKRDLVAEIAATLAFSAIENSDKVGVLLFTDSVEKYIPPAKGKKHILYIIREILLFNPEGNGTNIGSALRYLNKVVKKRATTFVISDFFTYENKTLLENELRLSSKKHDLTAIIVNDLREREMPNIGIVQMQDPETEMSKWVDTSSKKVRREYKESMEQTHKKLCHKLNLYGVDHTNVYTGDDFVQALLKLFAKR